MKVFVTGGTGVLGRRVVPLLVDRGHAVTVVARSDDKAALLRSQGALPAQIDIFDAEELSRVVPGHDAVVNLATHIPPVEQMGEARAWADNDRIRGQGSARLVEAAMSAGVERFVQESISYTYPDRGDEWIDETLPLATEGPTDSVAVAESNARRFATAQPWDVAVILRFGWFYGSGSDQTVGLIEAARSQVGPTFGPREHWIGSLHLDDAAGAVAAALDAPGGTYNVTDEPVRWFEFAEALAYAVGNPPWLRAAQFVDIPATLYRSQRVSNRAFRTATGWAPQYPSVREGWPAVLHGA